VEERLWWIPGVDDLPEVRHTLTMLGDVLLRWGRTGAGMSVGLAVFENDPQVIVP